MTPVTLPAAQALAGVGFDLQTTAYYNVKDELWTEARLDNWNGYESGLTSAPDILTAVLWLWEKYGVWCMVQLRENGWAWFVQRRGKMRPVFNNYENDCQAAYEKAILAACEWAKPKS